MRIMKLAAAAAAVLMAVAVHAETADVVVIGSGGAGLSSAVTLHDLGRKVVVLEKMPYIGGNTNRAEGGLNAAETEQQKKAGIPDTIDQFFVDTMKGGHYKNDPQLVHTLTAHAKDSVAWFTSLGGDLSLVGRAGGAKYNRAHRPHDGSAIGPEVMKTLAKAAEERKIDIRTESQAVKILRDKTGAVTGVRVKPEDEKAYTINAKAVVLAAGGFGANNKMVAKFRPDLKGYSTTNQPGATGDGITLAERAGAAFVDMREIQAHPTATPSGILISESVRGDGAVLINQNGKRFTNELLTRDVVSKAELAQPGKFAWIVWDAKVAEGAKLVRGYIQQKLTVQGNTLDELAAAMNVPADAFKATMAQYTADQKAGKDTAFARPNMPQALETAPFYAVKVQPSVHHTMGGVKIDTKAEVIGKNGKVIPGLFAAGEVTGGVHGGNRLGGNAQADIMTFGRISGQSADAYLKTLKK